MCSCLFITGDVLPLWEEQRKETKKNIQDFNSFLQQKKAKICGSYLRNYTEHIQAALPECVLYSFLNMIHIFLHTNILCTYVIKLNKLNFL